MSKRRIAFVINYIVNGGPSNVVRNIISNLNKAEYDITLITLFKENDNRVCQELTGQGARVIECESLTRKNCLLGQADEFNKAIEDGKFDIIHTHGLIPDILASRIKTKSKRITTIHNNMFEDYILTYGKIKGAIYIAIHLHALRKLDCIVGCSETSAKSLDSKIKNKVTFVRNGIAKTEVKDPLERKELKVPENAKMFVFAGNLSPGKDILTLIRQFKQYRNEDEYLVVLGSGPLESECKAEEDEHVKVLGFQKDPIAYYRLADVYTSASRSEGFSISVLEALDNGLGLLLSDIPSHREVIECAEDSYIGELFSTDFSQKLESLRKHDFDREKIRSFKDKKLSAKAMTDAYEEIYRN